MSYQVLARKWRPPDFNSLVGQDHVVTALRNAIADGRIAQAYLFSGIRGVGKTTAARVLAKALNCLNGPGGGPAADPCNECASCNEINSGATLDVLEVDAATYSKVEQVRELTETLRYGPARGRYKVVVLDEVHRLSRQAFDALLKIVEEPPAHLVFIFATTEIDAVPATILSRCQEFQFRRVASPVVAAHLRRICESEEITASDAALRLIARAGEGSVRDAVALLDQMSTFGQGAISDDDAAQLLAGFDAALFGRLLAAILEGRAPEVSAVAREVDANGWDPHHVFGQFLGFCRDALHLALGGDPENADLPAEEAKALAELVRSNPCGYQGLLQVLQLLLASEATVRRSEFGGVALEITWLRAAELPRVQRIEALLAGADAGPAAGSRGPDSGGGSGAGGAGGGMPLRGGPRNHAGQGRGSVPPRRTLPEEPEEPDRLTQAPETRVLDPKNLDPARLAAVLELLPRSLAGLLRSARLGLRDGKMMIVPGTEDRLVNSALSRQRNAEALEGALRRIYGPGVAWLSLATADGMDEYVPDAASASGSDSAPPLDVYDLEEPPRAQASSHDNVHAFKEPTAAPDPEALAVVRDLPTVQLVQSLFRGKIRSVRDEIDEMSTTALRGE